MSEVKRGEGLLDYSDIDHYAAKAAGWTWDDDAECYRDKDGAEIDWEDSDSIMIDPIEYGGHTYAQVNVWGDGTVEFQDEEGESENWAEFDEELLKRIYTVLRGKSESKKHICSMAKKIESVTKKNEAQDVRLGDLNINNALDWYVSKDDYCVVITDNGNRRFKVALYDANNNVLDEDTTTIYHAACYFRGTMEALYKKGGTDSLVFYRD